MLEKVLKGKKFTASLLDPQLVVDKVFNQIISGNSSQLFIPGSFSIAAGLRGWPAWIQGAVRRSQRNVLAHS